MNSRTKLAFRYELKSLALGAGVFIAIMLVITLMFAFLLPPDDEYGVSYNCGIFPFLICVFVFGVVELRASLRVGAQFGVSRRSSFMGSMGAVVLIVLGLAIVSEILSLLQAVMNGGVHVVELYHCLYLGNPMLPISDVSFSQHLVSIAFNTLLMIALYCFGAFFSAMFWRLHGFFIAVGAVGIVVVVNLVSYLLAVTSLGTALVDWTLAAPVNAMVLFVIGAVFWLGITWLIVRRANIRAAGKN